VDHYLPRKHYPEYSIYTDNLIAACGRCNRKKLTKYQRTGGGPAFIHPYLHNLPDESYLTCDVTIGATVLITFSVRRTSTMDAATFDTLSSHFTALDLASLYQVEALELMNEQRNSYYSYYRHSGADGVAKYLGVEAMASKAYYASGKMVRRHWKATLLAALADSAEFCDQGFTVLGEEFLID
jgi:hypothetical protein